MSRRFETSAVLMFLAAASVGFSQGQAVIVSKPQVSIWVYDYAGVSTELLATAEEDARRVFRQAGIETVWATCLPKPEKAQADVCYAVDATHLVLKILPRAIAAHVRDRGEVLGMASVDEQSVGYYAYAFYDNVQRLANERKLGHALLGDVLAHEIGHLLLGSRSHSLSGIMSAHWYGEELRRISEAAMFFIPSQSRIMRDRLDSSQVGIPRTLEGTGASQSSKVPAPGLVTIRE